LKRVEKCPLFSFVAYNKNEILQQALSAIEEHNCTKLAEVFLHLPIDETTLYTWEIEFLDKIKAKIADQKVKIKAKMKKRWFDSDNPALAIAAMKLIADEEEMEALNTSKVKQDNTHSFSDLPTVNFVRKD
jgi:hypothetical protein